MTTASFALFDTAIGRCGLAWGGRGIVGVQLPEASETETGARLRRRFPDAREAPPTPAVRRAIDGIVALLRGEAIDLSPVELDMEGVPELHRRVYETARTIPPGATLTYGDVAARLGDPGLARAVGQALGRNPFALIVPCHRVVAADGKLGGFSANGGVTTKRRLLTIEGTRGNETLPLFDEDKLIDFDEALQNLIDGATDPLEVERGSIMLLDARSQTLSIRVARGVDEGIIATTCVGLGFGIAGTVAETGHLEATLDRVAAYRASSEPQDDYTLLLVKKLG